MRGVDRCGNVVIIRGVGHIVVPKSPCAQQAFSSFLANPNALNTSWVAGLQSTPFTAASPTSLGKAELVRRQDQAAITPGLDSEGSETPEADNN
jgi:hypothetical protein